MTKRQKTRPKEDAHLLDSDLRRCVHELATAENMSSRQFVRQLVREGLLRRVRERLRHPSRE